MKTGRRIIFFLVYLAVAGAVCFAVAEYAVRVFLPQLAWRPFDDDYLGWSSLEYQNFLPPPGGSENRAGREEKMILVLGDSFLAGSGIERMNQRFSDRLGDMPGGTRVVTFASGGWGTDQELLAFIEKGKALSPDLVMIAFCAQNDLMNIVSNSDSQGVYAKYKPYFEIGAGGGLELFSSTGRPMDILRTPRVQRAAQRSYFLDLLRFHLDPQPNVFRANFGDADPFYYDHHYWEQRDPDLVAARTLDYFPPDGISKLSPYYTQDYETNTRQWRLMEKILGRFVEEAGGARVMLVMLPVPFSFQADSPDYIVGSGLEITYETPGGGLKINLDEPGRRLAGICARAGITFFDPTDEFIAEVRSRGVFNEFYPGDHFTAHAHALLAEQIHSFLVKNPGLLDR